ncbi:MAG: TldD/PmbA family protein [Candidatus Helarchaeota archaeon]|nr:TldD/PmbA family protein [Candidatus Helarchaeota archaeon]
MVYIEFGRKCLQLAESQGVDHTEVFITNARLISASIEKGSIKSAKDSYDHGISIRVVCDGSIGFSFSTDFEWKSLENMVITAVKLSKTGIPDPDFQDFPHPSSYPPVKGMFDKKISTIEIETALDYCLRTATAANLEKRVSAINIGFDCDTVENYLLNSNGIEESSRGTGIQITAEITAKENSERSSGFEFQASRFLKEVNPEFTGRSAAETALKSLHAKNIETGTYPVILHPFAAAMLFSSAIGAATNAESVQYKRTFLTNLRKQTIAADIFNVTDDGLLINKNGIAGLGTSKYDGEGVPRQVTPLISNGVLKNFLYDSYTAGKEGIQSTGNASRASYRSIPSIGISNLQIIGKKGDLNSFISETKKGILLYYTWDHPNIATGDFSGLISLGFKIENGTISYPLKKAMLGINMLDFFKQIYAVGTDYREIYQIVTPSICVSKVKIAGAN